ncbi:carbohydrate ABC transporter permease [Glycomyces harbinensis]|uniref:Multiple sugar transport system permease protein n=1 Tax=Glycomyces harbinensis TaxID=58114 RepID=A0A1G7BFA0_9ACTN|nr:carbohydrate ABC transporter permease [Glycomyces harbinensis]SDE25647.1 multiple sugar transport system permease protein [Glycomyces harbinensis]
MSVADKLLKAAPAITAGEDRPQPPARRGPRRTAEPKDRGVISASDRKRPAVKAWLRIVQTILLVVLIVSGLGPLLWAAKASISPSNDIVSDPMGIWFSPNEWGNLLLAWNGARIGQSLGNTVILALGSTLSTLIVSVAAAFLLSVLRPRWGPWLSGAIIATLFLPGVVSFVPLYLTILDMPLLNVSLQDTFWAVWLPAGASAFNVVVLKRFFDSIPREYMEAAKIDGAGPMRILTMVVLPLSRPILGVIVLLSVVGSWKEFLWPMLVLSNPDLQPVSVMLPRLATGNSPLSVQMAAVFLTIIIPVVLFAIFQKQFLRGVGTAGGVKG